MATSSFDVSSGPYVCNGATTQFSFSFRCEDYGDVEAEDTIKVILVTASTGVETVLTRGVSAGQYTVTLNGDQDSSPGGSITTISTYDAGYYLYIRTNPSYTQQTELTAQTGYNGPVHEAQFDQFQRQINDLRDKVRRSIVGSVQLGESFDGQITGDVDPGDLIVFNDDLTGFRAYPNNSSSNMVTSTGSLTARSLGDRFAEVRNILDFGAVGDGVADDYDAFMEAYDALPAEGGVIFVPPGYNFRTTEIIELGNGTASVQSDKQNVWVVGAGLPNGDLTTKRYLSRVTYDGTGGAPQIFRFNGPMTGGLVGITGDCNFKAAGIVYPTHAFRSRFKDLYCTNYMGSAFKIDAHAVGSHPQCTTGAVGNIWDNIYCAEPGATTVTAFECGLEASDIGDLDVARNVIRNFGFRTANNSNATGIKIAYCDIILFENGLVHAGVAANSCNAKLIKVPEVVGNNTFPQSIVFRQVAIIGDAVNCYDISANWSESVGGDGGIFFDPFLKADVESATNKIPNFEKIYGFTEEGQEFGRIKYKKTDVASRREVISSTTTAQPGSPTFEDIYIIPASATGTPWSTFAVGSFAQYRGGAWVEIVPQEGWEAYVKNTDRVIVWNGSAWVSRTPTVQVFTASGTYTPAAGVSAVLVEVRGAGGGGGGVSSAAGSLAASGGGEGGYSKELIPIATVGASQTVTVGAGGTAGANTGGAGGTGGTTSFGALLQATGGSGGAGATAAGALSGGAGGVGSGGDLNLTGQGGSASIGVTGTGPCSGQGGGEGGGRGRATTGAGLDGANGGGGSGAASGGATTANIGGVGGNGYVIVTEFY